MTAKPAPRQRPSKNCLLVCNSLLFVIATKPLAEAADANTIIGSSWVAIEYYNGTALVPPLPGSEITLDFEEGKLSGSGGCNSYSGTGTYSDHSFRFDAGISWTEMACFPWDLNEQEVAYFENFHTSVEYAISDDELELRDGDSKLVIAHFVPIGSAQTHSLLTELPAGSAPTESISVESVTSDTIIGSSWVAIEYYNWNELVPPIPGRPITLTFEKGKISGSGGCNSYSGTGTYAHSNSSFHFDEPIEWTECGELGLHGIVWSSLNEQEYSYLQNFRTSIEYSVLDGWLELRDGDTKTVIARYAPILRSTWVAIEYYNGTALVPPLPGSAITLSFEEGKISGNGGCNSYSGTGTYSNSSFLLDDGIQWTEIACTPWELNEQETSYFQNFDAITKYEILDDGNVLELREGDTGAVMARFALRQPASVEPAAANHTGPVTVATDIEKMDSADSPSSNVETEFESTESGGISTAADVAMVMTMINFMLLFV